MINEQKYVRLKEGIRAKDDKLTDIDQERQIEHANRVRQNERQSIKLKIDA